MKQKQLKKITHEKFKVYYYSNNNSKSLIKEGFFTDPEIKNMDYSRIEMITKVPEFTEVQKVLGDEK